MKKDKMLLILLIIGLGLIITGCGNSGVTSNTKSLVSKNATIINQEGEAETLTAKEVCSVYNENEAKFDKYYKGAEISFYGTVSEIDASFREEGGSSTVWDSVKFKEGFKLYLPSEVYDIADLSKGDILYVRSNIYSGFACEFGLDLRTTSGDVGYNLESLKETIVRNLTKKENLDIEKFEKLVDEEVKLYKSLEELEDKLVSIDKYYYAGVKLDSTFLENFAASTNIEVNFEVLEEKYSGIENKVKTISNDSSEIYNTIVEMTDSKNNEKYSVLKTNLQTIIEDTQILMDEIRKMQ